MPTAAELLPIIAPEIDASSPQSIGALAMAETEVGLSFEAEFRNKLVAYKAAHIITLSNRGGAGGAVNALREGELTIAYDNRSSGSALSLTSYGQQLEQLIRSYYGMLGRTGVMP